MRLVWFFAVVILYSTAGHAQQKMRWKTLEDDAYSIQYPDTWELNQSGQMGTSFILFSKPVSTDDQFRENVNLLIQDLTGQNIDLDQYVSISEGQVKTMMTNGVILQSKRQQPGRREFHKIIFSADQGIFKLKFEQYYWIRNEKAFVLTLTCEASRFDEYLPDGEKILSSFKLK